MLQGRSYLNLIEMNFIYITLLSPQRRLRTNVKFLEVKKLPKFSLVFILKFVKISSFINDIDRFIGINYEKLIASV